MGEIAGVGHTPGPWMVEPINDGQTYQITTTETTGFAVVAETPVDGTGRDAANARLIAAAPDLLEALQALLVMSGRGPQPRKFDEAISWRANDEKAQAIARAAILRATEGP